jgi:uncharacterized membrane protein YbhN (UPF0104 family)
LLFFQFRAHAGQISADQLDGAWVRLVLSVIGYFLCGLPLGIIWWATVLAASGRTPGAPVCIQAHLASQFGKYLPGNVVHFAARHLMMRTHGFAHSSLVAAGMLEALVLLLAALLLGAVAVRPAAEMLLGSKLPAGVEVLGGALVAMAAFGSWLYARRKGWLDRSLSVGRALALLLAAMFIALGFFAGMSGCFILVSDAFALSDFWRIVPWIAAAWMLGFIVPGAPGGIGVREFVLVLGLTPMIGEGPAILDAALFRLTTIGGDALMAVAGWGGGRLLKPEKEHAVKGL